METDNSMISNNFGRISDSQDSGTRRVERIQSIVTDRQRYERSDCASEKSRDAVREDTSFFNVPEITVKEFTLPQAKIAKPIQKQDAYTQTDPADDWDNMLQRADGLWETCLE